MRISKQKVLTSIDPNLSDIIQTISRNTSRGLLTTATVTDNSTGVAPSSLAPVLTQDVRVAQSGTNLASRTDFNNAMTAFNNAIAVLATFFNTNTLGKLDVPLLAGFTGTVATAGTVPALTKTVTGVDGSAGLATLRFEANASITRARNNLSHIVKAYNIVATALGVATISETTNGRASYTMNLLSPVTATTAVAAGAVATGDLASKANMDAALTALANDVAFIAARINSSLLATATLNARVPITLVP